MKVRININEDGDTFFLVPEKLKMELLLEAGDIIEWVDNKNGSWTLKKMGNSDNNTAQIYSVESIFIKYPALKAELMEVFGSADLGIEWLTSRVPVLSGLTPIEVIQKGSLKLVLDTLNKIKYGEYS
ncbi:uncharacterized protein DUF2384 [Vibrio diazotrophicus]|uniref:Uncharacterized protein DUF2384 n=1 Tax=Vibrio diazotrophicus TaxID=685 RepID=A0A329E4U2_VIBDI|nr:MbcA/ParS/Xre antitoxin family protein [Vibrio diazotrophicus]RAS59103.1 uncharacterized protein DUF2384 [Vibrio diazotrophicus]